MKATKLSYAVFAVIVGFLLNSCSKNDDDQVTDYKTQVNNIELVMSVFELMEEDEVSDENDGAKTISINSEANDCLTVTVIPNESGEFWPHNLKLDWGTENCLCADENYRRGIIYSSITAPRYEVGSVKTITFEDYYINDIKLDGVRTKTNSGRNESGNLTFTRQVEDGVAIYPDGTTITHERIIVSEWKEGENTITPTDDVFHLTGSSSGTNANQTAYTMQITEPLVYKFRCFYPVSGVKVFTVGDQVITLDFGEGECDNLATITINGETYEITLKRNKI